MTGGSVTSGTSPSTLAAAVSTENQSSGNSSAQDQERGREVYTSRKTQETKIESETGMKIWR